MFKKQSINKRDTFAVNHGDHAGQMFIVVDFVRFYDYLNVVDDREDLVDVGDLLTHQLLEVLGLAVQPAKSSTG